MIALVWGALTSRLAGPVAAACAVALACFLLAASLQVVGLKHKLGRAEIDRDQARHDYAACRVNREQLETAVSSQNAAVEAWRKETADRSREAEKAMQRARAGAVEATRRADAIRRQVSTQVCGDDLILESVR